MNLIGDDDSKWEDIQRELKAQLGRGYEEAVRNERLSVDTLSSVHASGRHILNCFVIIHAFCLFRLCWIL